MRARKIIFPSASEIRDMNLSFEIERRVPCPHSSRGKGSRVEAQITLLSSRTIGGEARDRSGTQRKICRRRINDALRVVALGPGSPLRFGRDDNFADC
jgi:hypothetical protein